MKTLNKFKNTTRNLKLKATTFLSTAVVTGIATIEPTYATGSTLAPEVEPYADRAGSEILALANIFGVLVIAAGGICIMAGQMKIGRVILIGGITGYIIINLAVPIMNVIRG